MNADQVLAKLPKDARETLYGLTTPDEIERLAECYRSLGVSHVSAGTVLQHLTREATA